MDSDYDYIKKQAEIEKELYEDFRKYKSQPNELQKQIQELRKEFSELKRILVLRYSNYMIWFIHRTIEGVLGLDPFLEQLLLGRRRGKTLLTH